MRWTAEHQKNLTMMGIQDALVERINVSAFHWGVTSHITNRPISGHYCRTRRGAVQKAKYDLAKLGFSADAANLVIQDAIDVAELHLHEE